MHQILWIRAHKQFDAVLARARARTPITIAFTAAGMYVFDSEVFLKTGAISKSALHMFGYATSLSRI